MTFTAGLGLAALVLLFLNLISISPPTSKNGWWNVNEREEDK